MSGFGITTKKGGGATAVPDACKTPAPPGPPIPVPYVNKAMFNQASAATCTRRVTIGNKPVVTKATEIPMSTGNEPGTGGGLMSGKNKGEARARSASACVKAEGQPVVFHGCVIAQNGKNANAPAGVHDAPSQDKVTAFR